MLFCAFKDLHFMPPGHMVNNVCAPQSMFSMKAGDMKATMSQQTLPRSQWNPWKPIPSHGLAPFSFECRLFHWFDTLTPTWRKEMTELERSAWIPRFLHFNLPKNLCVVKTNVEISHMGTKLGYISSSVTTFGGRRDTAESLYCLSL